MNLDMESCHLVLVIFRCIYYKQCSSRTRWPLGMDLHPGNNIDGEILRYSPVGGKQA